MTHSSRKPMGTRTLIAGVIIILVIVLAAFITPSNVGVNMAVVTSPPTLTRTDANGDPFTIAEASHSTLVGDHASFPLTWDAAKANTAPGQSMKIGIPALFRTLELGSQVDLTIDAAGEQTAIGQRKLGCNEVDHAFDRTVDSLKARRYAALEGKVNLRLAALAPTASSAAFTASGGQYKLAIPGGFACECSKGYSLCTFVKVTPVLTSENRSVFWAVSFGADYVAERLRETGQHMRPDEATHSTVTITDMVEFGQKPADPSKWVFHHRGPAGDKEAQDVRVTGGAGTNYTTAYGDSDMSVSTNGSTAMVSITGSWHGQTNYGIVYSIVSDRGQIMPNFAYVNTAGFDKTKIVKAVAAKYTDPFVSSGLVDMQHGPFTVTSCATGPHAEAIPRRVAFPMTTRYKFPAGTTASDYPSWNLLGTLAADKCSGTFSLVAGTGQKVDAGSRFPAGTKITVMQNSSAALSVPEGAWWGDPSYTVDGDEGNPFVVKANTVHGVAVSTEVFSPLSDVKPMPKPSPSIPASSLSVSASKSNPSSPTLNPSTSAPEPGPSTPIPSPSAISLALDPTTPPEPMPTAPSSHPTPSPTETMLSKPVGMPKLSSEPAGTMKPNPSPTMASPTEESSPTSSESPTAGSSESLSPSESTEPSPVDAPNAKASPSAAPSSPSVVVPPISPSALVVMPSPTDSQSPSGDPGVANPNGSQPSGKGKPCVRRPGSSINSPIVGIPVAPPTMVRAAEERPLTKTGLDMGTGVIFSVFLNLVGTGPVIRRYFS